MPSRKDGIFIIWIAIFKSNYQPCQIIIAIAPDLQHNLAGHTFTAKGVQQVFHAAHRLAAHGSYQVALA